MNSNGVIVGCLVDKIASRLPHRTGSTGRAFEDDEILQITRTTLVDLSRTTVSVVLESLVELLEDLGRPFACVSAHPSHILESELYILSLAAASCNANQQWFSEERNEVTETSPESLEPLLVNRILQALKQLLEPIPDDYILPAQTLLDQLPERNFCVPRPDGKPSTNEAECLEDCLVQFDAHIKTVVEFISASSWSAAFEHIRNTIYNIRTTPFPEGGSESQSHEGETTALVTLRLLSFFWIDSLKLGHIIQEICSSYLHFRKPYQCTIAVVLPLLVARWIDRYPDEFVRLHSHHKRRDGGGSDTLFDMTQTGVDIGRRRAVLYPMQITLLLLLPDVFEVASNLREAKSNNLIKKVSFLDSLRKALRNGNERAAYCLVALLRAARHFKVESDSALVSYAMDVQDEVRDSVFCLSYTGHSAPAFDQDMITGAFVSLAHLDPDGVVETLTKTCISPMAPDTFKIAVIQACSYFIGQPQAGRYAELHDNALSFIQSEFESECMNSLSSRSDCSPFSERKLSEILRYLEVSSTPLLHDLLGQNPSLPFLRPFLFCILSRNSSICRLATKVAKKLFVADDHSTETFGKIEFTADLRKRLWDQISSVLLGLCAGVRDHLSMLSITQLQEFLSARSTLLKGLPVISTAPADAAAAHEAALKLESTLLVSLCSPDVSVCQAATVCVGLIVEECAHAGVYSDSANLLSSTHRNNIVYEELSSPAFHFTGLVAFQKRMRGLLRQMRIPTQGILDAWEFGFERWIRLSKDVSMATADNVDDRLLSEWRNFSGFLASLGGICTHDHATRLDETSEDLQWIDRLFSEQHEEPLLTRFLRLAIQLLGCENIKVREAMREVLSTEVSSTLYPALFKALESELEVLLAGVLASTDQNQEKEVVFAEQAASLLKTMVEKLEIPSDLGSVSSVHLAALTLSFAKFLDGAPGGTTTLRVRVKICHLCEAVMKRKEHLNLRDDVRIRNQLLEHIFDWIARPYALKEEQSTNTNTGTRPEELRRVQKDLDKACLKTLADLTFRLPLQPADSQTDAGMSELKSQMFHTYFNRFLSLLNYETQEIHSKDFPYGGSSRDKTTSNADLVITILSNLLSANIDVGLKHSLNIGYHENVEIRAAFVRVLCNILTQGTEFSSLTDSAVSDKYVELLHVRSGNDNPNHSQDICVLTRIHSKLLTTDLSLSVSMSAICPASEVDELTICLLTVFEQRGLIFDLFEALIRQEIEQTATLQKVLERLMLTSQDLDLELDPARVSAPEELQKNAAQLQIVAKVFMDDICASVPDVPSSFRKICSIISETVSPRFPNAKYTAVGAFVFLRFFCPAIVAPETENLVSASPTKEMRRGLLLIAKIIQNLANNVLFGTKEPYMFPLNPFLVQNIHLVTGFLREISVSIT
ncbi:hypothetical protein EsDP_00001101 [Epichloe bromicola]|uniref:Ras-GAP domain-containing protein n=1 Tax=Epichloe bromicola TaxID=79588 RepID=A0ABQ0CGW5_9HYPO